MLLKIYKLDINCHSSVSNQQTVAFIKIVWRTLLLETWPSHRIYYTLLLYIFDWLQKHECVCVSKHLFLTHPIPNSKRKKFPKPPNSGRQSSCPLEVIYFMGIIRRRRRDNQSPPHSARGTIFPSIVGLVSPAGIAFPRTTWCVCVSGRGQVIPHQLPQMIIDNGIHSPNNDFSYSFFFIAARRLEKLATTSLSLEEKSLKVSTSERRKDYFN